MQNEIFLSIVIPAYKEARRIRKILDAIFEFSKVKDYNIETIVVVDGSPDQTAEAAQKYDRKLENLRVIDRKENKGKGYSVKEGMLAAKGEFVLFADADNSTPVEQVDKLLKYKKDYDVIIGSRYVYDGKLAIPQSFIRKTGGRILNLFIRTLAVPGIKDTQCGFKLFSAKAAAEVFSKQTFERWSFDIEILSIARSLGYKIREVGITWYDDPHSNINPIKDGLRMIKDAWTVRKNIKSRKYSRI